MSLIKIETDGEFFNAKDTLECGQIFRYKPINDGFLVQSGDKCCVVENKGSVAGILCEARDEDYFRNYFDLDTDYSAIVRRSEERR